MPQPPTTAADPNPLTLFCLVDREGQVSSRHPLDRSRAEALARALSESFPEHRQSVLEEPPVVPALGRTRRRRTRSGH